MEEKSNPPEDHHSNGGWQQVTYAKRRRQKTRTTAPKSSSSYSAKIGDNGNVFSSLEKSSDERRRKIEAQMASAADNDGNYSHAVRAFNHPSEVKDDDSNVNGMGNGNLEKKKKKKKKKEKPKMTVDEAATKIDAGDLATYLSEMSASYGSQDSQQEVQLMRFADYFGRAFSAVGAAQFPWLKLFRESKIEKIANIPLCHIREAVYKTSVDWIDKHSQEALGSFLIWSLNSILADMKPAGSKWHKNAQDASSKSQVVMFLVISMVLRRKPHVLVNLLPILKDNAEYHGEDKLPVIIWMIVQASQGDLTVGLYLWAHHVLPRLGGKSGSNPQTRDLVLQLVERIVSAPNAQNVLAKGAVKNGQRLVPPSAVDLLLRLTFPAASARVKETDRFEAIYPTLIYVALAGAPRSKAMKQLSQQILPIVMQAAGEGITELSKEAAKIFIWCLIQNPECYKHWERTYENKVEASITVMKRLGQGWRELRGKLSALEDLRDTLKSFRQKNKKASNGGADSAHRALIKESDKCCKDLLTKIQFFQYGWNIIASACFLWMAIGVIIYNFGLKETM